MRYLLVFGLLSSLIAASANAQSHDDDFKDKISSLSEDEQVEILMGAGDPVRLYNFTSGEKEVVYRVDQVSADKFEEFLPPLPEVKSLYRLYIAHDLPPYDAYSQAMSQLVIMLRGQE